MIRNLLLILYAAVAFAAIAATGAVGQEISAVDILERVDRNMTIDAIRSRARMIIHYREGDVRTLEFTSWAQGTEESFLEFTSPARDAGSRFLRRDDAMWIFLPRVGKSVRIQGHMLRQGLMGSDFSYGDASENPSMVEDYDGVVEREEELDGRPTYVLLLTAKRRDLSYPSRRIWVDSERWIPLKEERFARSGKLIKTTQVNSVRRVEGRWFPFEMVFKDELKTGKGTEFVLVSVEFDADIPDYIFSKASLR